MNEELFGELHEQEEYGLFGKEHYRQQCFLHSVSVSVCEHDYVYKILHDHTAADVCTKCGNIKKQTDC